MRYFREMSKIGGLDLRQRVSEILSAVLLIFDPLPFDGRVASSYDRLPATTVSADRKRETRKLDLMITATAHADGAHLVTANPRDVEHLADPVPILPVLRPLSDPCELIDHVTDYAVTSQGFIRPGC